jgi:hypothetical protein
MSRATLGALPLGGGDFDVLLGNEWRMEPDGVVTDARAGIGSGRELGGMASIGCCGLHLISKKYLIVPVLLMG